jgi:hypothetical protein
MGRRRSRYGLAVLAMVMVTLSASNEGRAGDAAQSVPNQMAAAAYLQQWAQFVWGLATVQCGTAPTPVGDPVINPDGSLTMNLAAPDGTTVVLTNFMDGSSRLVANLPDRTTQVFTNSAPAEDGALSIIYSTLDSSDGISVDYATALDMSGTPGDPADDVMTMRGSAVLPGGTTQVFSAVTASARMELESAQSDGSRFVLSVPLVRPFFELPDFTLAATGAYTDGGTNTRFTLRSTPSDPSRWGAFLCDSDSGVTGTFALNADFSGFGQIVQSTQEGAQPDALITWTRDGDVAVYSLDGSNLHTGPGGAALDFLLHRWETLTALMGTYSWGSTARVRPRRRTAPSPRVGRPASPRRLRTAAARSPAVKVRLAPPRETQGRNSAASCAGAQARGPR